MALCLADSLLECGGYDSWSVMDKYCKWQSEATARILIMARYRHAGIAIMPDMYASGYAIVHKLMNGAMVLVTVL